MKKLKIFAISAIILGLGTYGFCQEAEKPEQENAQATTISADEAKADESKATVSTEKTEVGESEKTKAPAKNTKTVKAKESKFEQGFNISKRNGLENKNAIGAYIIGAQTSIGGLQYERRFNDTLSLKTNMYVYYCETSSAPLDYNVNFELDFRLYEFAWRDFFSSRLFAYVMAGHRGFMSEYNYYDSNEDNYIDGPMTYYPNVICAAGFGFDTIFYDHFSIPIQVGFTGAFPNEPFAGFCVGTGLRYSF